MDDMGQNISYAYMEHVYDVTRVAVAQLVAVTPVYWLLHDFRGAAGFLAHKQGSWSRCIVPATSSRPATGGMLMYLGDSQQPYVNRWPTYALDSNGFSGAGHGVSVKVMSTSMFSQKILILVNTPLHIADGREVVREFRGFKHIDGASPYMFATARFKTVWTLPCLPGCDAVRVFGCDDPTESIIVPESLVDKAATYCVGKPRNVDTFKACVRATKDSFVRKDLAELVPEGNRAMTALIASSLGFEHELSLENAFMARVVHGTADMAVSIALHRGTGICSMPKWPFVIALILVLAGFAMAADPPTEVQTAPSVDVALMPVAVVLIYTTMIAPILEESLKHSRFWILSLALCLYEFASHVQTIGVPISLLVLIFHGIWALYPLGPSILMHASWNIATVLSNLRCSGVFGMAQGTATFVAIDHRPWFWAVVVLITACYGLYVVHAWWRTPMLSVDVLPSECERVIYGHRVIMSTCTGDDFVAKPQHVDTVITTMHEQCAPTLGCYLIGIGARSVCPVVQRNCAHSDLRAVTNRAGMDPDNNPVLTRIANAAGETTTQIKVVWWRSAIQRVLYFLSHAPEVPFVDFEAWLARDAYSETFRKTIRHCRSVLAGLTRGKLSGFDRIKAFTKIERLPQGFLCLLRVCALTGVGPTIKHEALRACAEEAMIVLIPCVDKDPRLIQGRLDTHKTATMPYCHTFSTWLKGAWDGTEICGEQLRLCYASGRSVEYLSATYCHWMAEAVDSQFFLAAMILGDDNFIIVALESQVYCVWADGHRHDAHVGIEALGFEHAVMSSLACDEDPWVCAWRDSESARCTTRGATRHKVDFEMRPQRHSGDGDTSSSNTMDLAAIVTDVYVRWNSVKDVATFEPPIAAFTDLVLDAYARSGHDPEVGYEALGEFSVPIRGEFCSRFLWPIVPSPDNHFDAWAKFGPKPGRVIAKTFYSCVARSMTNSRALLRGVCRGLLMDCAHVPVARVVISATLSILGEGKLIEKCDPYRLRSTRADVGDSARSDDIMAARYDLAPHVVTSLEQLIAGIRLLPAVVESLALDALIVIDCP
jgi:hypothetical protein